MSATFVKLGSVAEFINGVAFKPEDWGDSGTKIIRIQNLTDPSKPFNRTNRTVSDKYRIRPRDLLVSWSATLGVFEWFGPDEALLNQHIFRVLPDEKKVEKRYLRYALEGALLDMQRHLHGATMQHVNRGEFLNTKLFLPSLPEQRRIADILDRAEVLRAKRRASLAQLDELTQAIFIDMFGDPVTNPKGWQTIECANICERITVGIVVKPASYYVPSGVPALRSLNIKPGYISLEDLVYFSEHDNNTKLAKTKLKAGDLVIVRTGQPGTSAVVPADLDGVNAIDLLIATPKPNIVNSVFLSQFFNSSGGRSIVLTAQRGQVQKHLNVGSLNESCIPLPPIKLQQEFSHRVEAIEKLKTAHKTSLTEHDELFSSLQYRAFRGELGMIPKTDEQSSEGVKI